jgi:DNA topoisomerase-3
MGKTLVICETRSIADAVSRALGGTFALEPAWLEGHDKVLTWTEGPLAALAAPEHYDASLERWQLEDLPIIPAQLVAVARTESEAARHQLEAIRTLARRRDIERLVNACAPGPAGELEFLLLRELVGADGLPVERAWLDCLTRPAVRAALADLRSGSELHAREDAVRARAEADWLVGVNGTRAATVRARALGGRVTLGRVLTPALAMLVRREREIEAFVPATAHVVDGAFEPVSGSARFRGRWFRGSETSLADAREGEAIAAKVRDGAGRIREISTHVEHLAAPAAYDLATLQRDAGSRLAFTARRTLAAAHECYEHALVGYPRDRSSDEGAIGAAQALRVAQPAHLPKELGDDARQIYDMLARRLRAASLPPAVLARTTVISEIEGERFRSHGSVVREAGWYAAYDEPPGDETAFEDPPAQELPELREGQDVRAPRCESAVRETRPPARFDDASLLAALGGAAGSETIERLLELGYATREARSLMPTAKGVQVIDLLGEHAIVRSEPLRSFEARLQQVASGAASREQVVGEIATFTRDLVEHLRTLPEERTRFPRRELGIVCPRCGEGTLIENRKGFGCSSWTSREEPGCGFVIWKSIAGRQIGEEIVRELVAKGRTRELTGFRSRAGRAFSASLALEPQAEQPVTFSFEPRRGATGRTRA